MLKQVHLINSKQIGNIIGPSATLADVVVVEWKNGTCSRHPLEDLVQYKNYLVDGFRPIETSHGTRTTYEVACSFIGDMTRAGFESNITAGGVTVFCAEDQIDLVILQANKYGCTVSLPN